MRGWRIDEQCPGTAILHQGAEIVLLWDDFPLFRGASSKLPQPTEEETIHRSHVARWSSIFIAFLMICIHISWPAYWCWTDCGYQFGAARGHLSLSLSLSLHVIWDILQSCSLTLNLIQCPVYLVYTFLHQQDFSEKCSGKRKGCYCCVVLSSCSVWLSCFGSFCGVCPGLHTYLLTHSLHGAESFLRSQLVCS